MTLTTKSITEVQIESLKSEAGQAGDFRQVGLCVLALDGEIDFDDYTTLRNSAIGRELSRRSCSDGACSWAAASSGGLERP